MDDGAFKVKGRFRKIFKGGPDKDWAFTLSSFVAEDAKTYTVYMNKTKIEIDAYYEIDIKKQTGRSTYYLNNLTLTKPETSDEVFNLLLSNVKGLGSVTIRKIENKLGKENLIKIIDKPEHAKDIVSDKVYENLKEFCKTYTSENLAFFVDNNLTLFHNKLKQKFGKVNFVEIYSNENPYTLYTNHRFNIETVDYFAQKVNPGIPLNLRIQAFIYYAFSDLEQNNNTLHEVIEIVEKTQFLFYRVTAELVSEKNILEALNDLINTGDVIFDKDSKRVTLADMKEKEEFIVKKLIELNSQPEEFEYDETCPKTFSDEQRKAFQKTLRNRVSIISGYPGTGKSFIISHIIKSLLNSKKYKKKDIAVLTPTGRAATLLSDKTEVGARTIHSFLKLSKDDEIIESYETENETKVIIIDEFSMVSINIFYLLLDICSEIEKLIIVGDENQLPCIGPGNLLEELIQSELFPVSKLTEIFRTDKLDIFHHFLAINQNKLPDLKSESVEFVEYNQSEFLKNIINIYENKVQKYGMDEVIVLLPTYHGRAGINNVNNVLQQWNVRKNNLNIHFSLVTKNGSFTFYEGDKVIQLVNDYEKDIFNGEIGYIKKINKVNNNVNIIVAFGNKEIEYEKSEVLENLKLAYAITIHKFQGSEASCIIFGILKNQAENMLSKKLLYTGVSRAKAELLLLGSTTLYNQKIKSKLNNEQIYTNTMNFLNKQKKKD